MNGFDDVRIDQDELQLLAGLFNQHFGLVFGPESGSILERRLRERLHALAIPSFAEYYQHLCSPGGQYELQEAVDLITINETYFFREDYQIYALRDELIPRLAYDEHREWLSIWSAGCSTGEEAYTIGIAALESQAFAPQNIRIFGSDISRRCVAAARRGVYQASAFRATTPEQRRRYFVDRPDGAHVVSEVRDLCHFGQLNLLDTARAGIVGRVDVIFCRNVLIYFDALSRKRVIDMFYERLLPGGFLLLGHSESLLNVSTAFELVHLRGDLVYRKPLSASRFGALGQ